jgi:hypothetical protein
MDLNADIVPFVSRRYEAIPITKIKVINSRNRDQEQFEMNVGSIKQNGMLKPVRVNDKFFSRSGLYELICGEGRLTAHQRLGHETIVAEAVTFDRKEAYLQSLIENIARTKPDSMDFVREIIQLLQMRHHQGAVLNCISREEPELYKTIASRFGSLRSALIDAGIPLRPLRRWTKRSIIETLRIRNKKGPPLTNVWKDDNRTVTDRASNVRLLLGNQVSRSLSCFNLNHRRNTEILQRRVTRSAWELDRLLRR